MRIMLVRVHHGIAPLRPIRRRPYWLWAFLAGQHGRRPTMRDARHIVSYSLGRWLPYELIVAWGRPDPPTGGA
jgi:hypothetical protein